VYSGGIDIDTEADADVRRGALGVTVLVAVNFCVVVVAVIGPVTEGVAVDTKMEGDP